MTCSCGYNSAKGSAKSWTSGLENFIPAVAYHFCPSLPAVFTQPGASTLADLCIWSTWAIRKFILNPSLLAYQLTLGQLPNRRTSRPPHRPRRPHPSQWTSTSSTPSSRRQFEERKRAPSLEKNCDQKEPLCYRCYLITYPSVFLPKISHCSA